MKQVVRYIRQLLGYQLDLGKFWDYVVRQSRKLRNTQIEACAVVPEFCARIEHTFFGVDQGFGKLYSLFEAKRRRPVTSAHTHLNLV